MPEPTVADRVLGSPSLRRQQAMARRLARALGRVEIEGLQSVPDHGPVVLAVNHRSMLDGPLLFGFVQRPVTCLVKAEAFTPRMAPVLLAAGQIPVVRETVDPRPIRICLEVLRAGGVVGIFPEGTRGDGLVHTAKPGVGYFALRSGATVIPVALTGTFEMARRRTARRPEVRMVFGSPLQVERYPDDRPLNRRTVAATAERIRAELADLVRGVAGSRSADVETEGVRG